MSLLFHGYPFLQDSMLCYIVYYIYPQPFTLSNPSYVLQNSGNNCLKVRECFKFGWVNWGWDGGIESFQTITTPIVTFI